MQLGLTWPLQRLLKVSVPYGEPINRGLCWDAHCITLHGRSSLLLVHCASRYTCVRYDLSPMDWKQLEEIVQTALCEAQIESLVIAKGYKDCVAYISNGGISIAVAAPEGGLAQKDVAVIADIVMTQSQYGMEDIRVVEVQ